MGGSLCKRTCRQLRSDSTADASIKMLRQGGAEAACLPCILEAPDSWAEGLWKRVPEESDSPDLSWEMVVPRSVKRATRGASRLLMRGFSNIGGAFEC